MEYSKDNRLISYNGEEVKFDEDGNMTYGPLNGVMTEFKYDCRNRLIKAGDTEYTYDAEDNQIAVTKNGVTTKYVVDSNCEYSQVLTATTDDSVITYIYGDGLIAQESEQDYVTYHYNQVGSTTALTNENGNVIETYEYSPYGDILDGDSSLTMFLYNGKYGVASDDNGLYYMRERYYNVSIKRFINQDVVIGHLDATSSLNRYAYCEGNPVSFLDPFGLNRIDTERIHNLIGLLNLELFAVGAVLIFGSNGALASVVVSGYTLANKVLGYIDAALYVYDFLVAETQEERDTALAGLGTIGVTIILNKIPNATTIRKVFSKEIADSINRIVENLTAGASWIAGYVENEVKKGRENK